MNDAGSKGFTVVELVVFFAIIGMLVGLLLPAVIAARESSRKVQCSSNLQKLGLALHAYQDSFQAFPALRHGSPVGGTNFIGQNRLSIRFALMPFMDQSAFYARGMQSSVGPYDSSDSIWRSNFDFYMCPSNGSLKQSPGAPDQTVGVADYYFFTGDRPARSYIGTGDYTDYQQHSGAFLNGAWCRVDQITDGMSNTLGISEGIRPQSNDVVGSIVIKPASCSWLPAEVAKLLNKSQSVYQGNDVGLWAGQSMRGYRAWDGAMPYSGVQAAVPPNDVCVADGPNHTSSQYLCSPSSHHSGGVNVAFMDGAVKFVSEDIDVGDQSSDYRSYSDLLSPSPYGVWGAMATKGASDGTTCCERCQK